MYKSIYGDTIESGGVSCMWATGITFVVVEKEKMMDKFDALREIYAGKRVCYKDSMGTSVYYLKDGRVMFSVNDEEFESSGVDCMSNKDCYKIEAFRPISTNLSYTDAIAACFKNPNVFAVRTGFKIEGNAFGFKDTAIRYYVRRFDGLTASGSVLTLWADHFKNDYNVYNVVDIEKVNNG
jgi:hypothetical protein